MGQATNDDDFSEEIHDIGVVKIDASKAAEAVFSIQYGNFFVWLGFKRHASKLTEHHECCFGINHWCCSKDHQLFMLDVVSEMNQGVEADSFMKEVGATSSGEDHNLKTTDS